MRYVKIDKSFLEDERFIKFDNCFTSINLSIGAWFRAICLVSGYQKRACPRAKWDAEDLPIELFTKGLFLDEEGWVKAISPSYCGSVSVKDTILKISPDDLMRLWNENRGSMHKCIEMQGARRRRAFERLRESDSREEWLSVIQWLASSPWHTGRNDRRWIANIDFLLRPETRVRILEKMGKELGRFSLQDL